MTTPDAPRHLPPTPAERLKTIATRAAAGSGQGSTGFYRPVTQPKRGSDSGVGTVITGEGAEDATSITSANGGYGSSSATGLNGAIAIGTDSESLGSGTVAIGAAAYAIGGPDPTNLGATAIGPGARAEGDEATAIGASTEAHSAGSSWGPVAVGAGAAAYGDAAIAIGRQAAAGASGSEAAGAVAIGAGALAPNANDFVLGNGNHNVQVPGKFILTDVAGGQWQLVVSTGGVLSVVAFP